MKKRPKILNIILLICLIVFIGKFLSSPLNNGFHKIFSPLEKYLWNKGQQTGTFFYYFFQAKNIHNQNEFLKQQNAFLIQKNFTLTEQVKESDVLRIAFDVKSQNKLNLTYVRVVSKPVNADTILIDKGAKNGLTIGMPIITAGSVLAGKIKKVENNFSEVELITANDFSFDVKIKPQDESKETVVALAKGGGNFKLFFDFAQKETAVVGGDLVFTAGLSGDFPEGLLVGQIEQAQINPAQSFQTGDIKAYFKDSLKQGLFVILNYETRS